MQGKEKRKDKLMDWLLVGLYTMAAVFGLLIAGAETKNIGEQFFCSSVGIILFMASGYALMYILRRMEDD